MLGWSKKFVKADSIRSMFTLIAREIDFTGTILGPLDIFGTILYTDNLRNQFETS